MRWFDEYLRRTQARPGRRGPRPLRVSRRRCLRRLADKPVAGLRPVLECRVRPTARPIRAESPTPSPRAARRYGPRSTKVGEIPSRRTSRRSRAGPSRPRAGRPSCRNAASPGRTATGTHTVTCGGVRPAGGSLVAPLARAPAKHAAATPDSGPPRRRTEPRAASSPGRTHRLPMRRVRQWVPQPKPVATDIPAVVFGALAAQDRPQTLDRFAHPRRRCATIRGRASPRR